MSFARACAGAVVFVVAATAVETPALAGNPTGTPAANPAHPVWNSNKAKQPKIKLRPARKLKATKTRVKVKGKKSPTEEPPSHELPPEPLTHPTPWIHAGEAAPAAAEPMASPTVRPPEELAAALKVERHQRAEQAYAEAQALLAAGERAEAIEQLDMATELDPSWSAPVKLRAETFGALALRYAPSEAFLAAQAVDLRRLMALEPNVEAVARTQQLIALKQDSEEARRKEARRRKMVKPALIVGSASVALIVGGVFMAAGMAPSTDSDALHQRNLIRGGIVMASVGVALAPVAITLAVLAGKQARRDQATRELNAYTGRPQPTLSLGPKVLRGGGGVGLDLRF